MRSTTCLLTVLLLSVCSFAQQMNLKIFNQANTPVFTTNTFKAVGAGKGGYLWAGTANAGLYKYNGKNWEKSLILSNNNISQIANDDQGNIWIAQYGNTGAQAINGGLNFFGDSTFLNPISYSSSNGLPTRNARSIFINNNLITGVPKYRVWSAHLGDLTGGVSKSGAVGRGTSSVTPAFRTITTGVQTTNELGSCQTVGGSNTEVWVFASVNTQSGLNQLLRYNINTEAFIGAYDQTNSNLPAGFSARAIYFDNRGVGWIGLQSGGVSVFTSGTFRQINFSSLFPSGTAVNINAITGDGKGNVYIGTTTGLIVFNGNDVADESSYKKYTVANGLPSDNIQSIVANQFVYDTYNVVMGTGSGIVLWEPEYRTRYNNVYLNREMYIDRSSNLRIAVDSSTATLVKAWIPNSKDCILRYKEDINSQDPALYGKFILVDNKSDTITCRIKHPWIQNIPSNQFSRLVHLQIYDTLLKKVLYEENIDFVRPPLFLVHGLFSNGTKAFSNMRSMLINEGMYKPWQIYLAEYPASSGMASTLPIVTAEKKIAMYQAIMYDNISCGKLDVAGHSMGGLLLRLYLQSNQYKNDVNRYISFNSPHMGSPVPNFVLNTPGLEAAAGFLMEFPQGGALSDLRVNSPIILDRLIKNNPQEPKVPSHAIVTTFFLPSLKFQIPTGLVKWEQSMLLSTLVYAHNGFAYWNNTLFGGIPHDGVVSEMSQRGGLAPTYYSQSSGISHISTGGPDQEIYNRFKELLNLPANATAFTTTGFAPTVIPVPNNLNRIASVGAGTLQITSPVMNAVSTSGSKLIMNFRYTLVDTMILMIGNPNSGVYAKRVDAPTTADTIEIPKEFIGRTKISLIGYNQNGYSAQDSVYIDINTTATLDSIACAPRTIRVPKTGLAVFELQGYYNDTSRVITGTNGITYEFAKNKAIFVAPNFCKGLVEGTDTMRIFYGNKIALVPLEVTDSTEWAGQQAPGQTLPSRLGALNVQRMSGYAALTWDSFDDVSVLNYEILYSTDGYQYNSIGSVQPENSAQRKKYAFRTSELRNKNNFYKLGIIDKDGSITYSNVVSILGREASAIEIKSNPIGIFLSFTIRSDHQQSELVEIFDVSGKKVFVQDINLFPGISTFHLNVNHLAKGNYFVKFLKKNDILTIVKQ